MSFWEVALIGIGLSMDAFAVALGKGLAMKTLSPRKTLWIAVAFGGFQALMPLIGWLLGSSFSRYIEAVDHWIAFVLLLSIGGKMIRDALKEIREEKEKREKTEGSGSNKDLRIGELLILAVATSIDALAVGLSFAMLGVSTVSSRECLSIWYSILIIGLETFVLSGGGVLIGHRFGSKYHARAEIAGGIILILIGIRILISHMAG